QRLAIFRFEKPLLLQRFDQPESLVQEAIDQQNEKKLQRRSKVAGRDHIFRRADVERVAGDQPARNIAPVLQDIEVTPQETMGLVPVEAIGANRQQVKQNETSIAHEGIDIREQGLPPVELDELDLGLHRKHVAPVLGAHGLEDAQFGPLNI